MGDTKACYGRRFGQKEQCDGCEEAPWCRDAADPKPLTGPNAGPTGDDAAYETMQAMETAGFEWAGNAARIFAELVRVCDSKPDRIAAVCMRVSGMSYSRIGQACGKTKQAVDKDLARIGAASPEIGRALRRCYSLAVEIGALNDRLAEAAGRLSARGRVRLCGPDGLYGRLALEFGLPSWPAARMRLSRLNAKVDGRSIGRIRTGRAG